MLIKHDSGKLKKGERGNKHFFAFSGNPTHSKAPSRRGLCPSGSTSTPECPSERPQNLPPGDLLTRRRIPTQSPGTLSHAQSSYPKPGPSEPSRDPPDMTGGDQRDGAAGGETGSQRGRDWSKISQQADDRAAGATEAPARWSAVISPRYTLKRAEWKLLPTLHSGTKMPGPWEGAGHRHACSPPTRGGDRREDEGCSGSHPGAAGPGLTWKEPATAGGGQVRGPRTLSSPPGGRGPL